MSNALNSFDSEYNYDEIYTVFTMMQFDTIHSIKCEIRRFLRRNYVFSYIHNLFKRPVFLPYEFIKNYDLVKES